VTVSFSFLFHKYQIDGADNEQESQDVVPMQMRALEENVRDDTEHRDGYAFLDYLELYDVERTSVLDEAQAVGRHLAAILKEGNAPRECYHADERPVAGNARLL